MKVISLNTWGGKGGTDALLSFFKKYSDADIFCLQEVFNGGEQFRGMTAARFKLEHFDPKLLERIQDALPEHRAHFRPHFEDIFGLALFVRDSIVVAEEGDVNIYRERGYYSKENIADQHRILQYVTLAEPACSVLHVHGLWDRQGKGDTEDRLMQSKSILQYVQSLATPFVLLGDFNLRPETESIRQLEAAGMRNLIAEYEIASTRTKLYDSRDREPHADYAFVGPGIVVKEFRVLPDEVSDHAALYLDFELA